MFLSPSASVCMCACVCLRVEGGRDTPSPEMQVFLSFLLRTVSTSLSFHSSLFTPPSPLPFFMSARFLPPLLLPLFSPALLLLPPGSVCIPARRGGGVCDLGSIWTRPPSPFAPSGSPSPSPPAWEKWTQPSSWQGTSSPLFSVCTASRGSGDLT